MRTSGIKTLMMAGALLAPWPASGQDPPRTELEEALGRPKVAPLIPPELRAMVRVAERDRLVVRGLDGADIAIDISQKEPERFAQFAGGRFFGFSFIGYEHFGFVLVDRAAEAAAAVIETGEAPVFSSDGRYFAAAQITEGGFGNLEALAAWEVLPGRTLLRFFTDALPRGSDWRIDGWPAPACVSISAVGTDWQPPEGVDYGEGVSDAPRNHYRIGIGETVTLMTGSAGAVCGVVPAE